VEPLLAVLKGKKIFSYHRTLTYFADWTGVDVIASVEPKPGVPPPPSHLADLVGIAKAQGVKAILVESYYDQKSSKAVASHCDAAVVVIPGDVGAEDTRDYLGYLGTVLERVAAALK
jgi:zinc/manganese transport system substrate-binding protein